MNEFKPSDWEQLQRISSRLPNRSPYSIHILYVLTKYTSILMTNPFESAVTLKQVQFMPKKISEEERIEEQEVESETEIEMEPIIQEVKQEQTDSEGYLLRMRTKNDPTFPSYQLPSLEQKSTFQIVRQVMYSKDEGFLSLWKGSSAYFYRVWLTPLIQSSIQSLLRMDNTPLVQVENVSARFPLIITSYFLTGILLSPLELVQTRMVVQTSKKGKRKYKSTLHALYTIQQEEFPDDVFGIITAQRLLFPSLIYHFLNPIFQHSAPVILDRLVGATPDDSFLFVATEFGIGMLELLVMLPIETVRKRMQCQVIRKTPVTERERNYEGLVELDPIPYTSMLDCLYRIVTEESFSIARLYRGFKARFMTNIVVALLQLLSKSIDRE